MQEQNFAEITAMEKRIYAKLNAVMEITQELAEAVSRRDRVAVQMLISTRQQPILDLQDLRAMVQLKRCDLSGEDEQQFDRLFSDGDARTEAEIALTGQLAANRRLLERVVALDRRVSEQMCREKSYYVTHGKKIMSREGA